MQCFDITKVLLLCDYVQILYAINTSPGGQKVYRFDAEEFEELFGAHLTAYGTQPVEQSLPRMTPFDSAWRNPYTNTVHIPRCLEESALFAPCTGTREGVVQGGGCRYWRWSFVPSLDSSLL